MKRTLFVVALALLAPVVASAPASARPMATESPTGGLMTTVHSHSNDDPDWDGLLFETDRLSYDFVEGENFNYSSRTCGGRAPFNDLGVDFTPDFPGVDDDADSTAAVRHHVEGTVTEVKGKTGTIEGTITSVLCVMDESGNQVETDSQIVFDYQARYVRVSEDEVRVTGTWVISPTESTGVFEGLEGKGSLQGILTCLSSTVVCADAGHFTDFVAVRGDPTLGPGELKPGITGIYRFLTTQTA